MLVFERSDGVGESILIGQHLSRQLIQRAQPLFEPPAIDDKFADQIEQAFQPVAADPDHFPLFSGFSFAGSNRLSRLRFMHIKGNDCFSL